MQLEGRKSSGLVDRVHDRETDPWQRASPASLVPSDVVPEALVHRLVGTLASAVRFRVEGRRHPKLHSSELREPPPEA